MEQAGKRLPGAAPGWYAAAEIVTLTLTLQALWLLGVLAGGVVLGVAPASVAAASVARAHVLEQGAGAWRLFWTTWRAEFASSTLAALPLVALAAMAAVNALAFAPGGGPLSAVMVLPAAVVAGAVIWFPPLYAHYTMRRGRYWLMALRLVVQRPLPTVVLIVGHVALAYAASRLPALAVFVAVGAALYLATFVALATFRDNEDRLGDGVQPEPAFPLPAEPLRMH